ncbi:hypothetical protein FACS1894125_7190 [Actinomycetota bacterium]|nr:hypothetical protein FACS1894125_7190 [Actinomycetota bacterium]
MKDIIKVQGSEISVKRIENSNYISLTDMAKYRDINEPYIVIANWMRTQFTIDYLSLWEKLHNNNFNPIEIDRFKLQSGANGFTMTPRKWVDSTNAMGMYSKAGRHGGGTFAHIDIAMEFASWLSPEFKVYLITEFQRLKQSEATQHSLNWNLSRTLAKINYRIQTDAVREFLIPPELTEEQANFKYAEEADVLNMALFGKTAKQWREQHPNDAKTGNIRDYAPLEHLIVLSNLESINAMLIGDELPQKERLLKLNRTAITQLKSLYTDSRIDKLQGKTPQKRISSS